MARLLLSFFISALCITAVFEARAEEFSQAAEVILRDQLAWIDAVEDTKKISVGKSSRRSKKKQLAINQAKIEQLMSQLTENRQTYRVLVRERVFGDSQDSQTFEFLSAQGAFFCFSTEGGRTGFCTQENTNRTFTW